MSIAVSIARQGAGTAAPPFGAETEGVCETPLHLPLHHQHDGRCNDRFNQLTDRPEGPPLVRLVHVHRPPFHDVNIVDGEGADTCRGRASS